MPRLSRLLTLAASLLLLVPFAAPLWRIALLAPQYPEGLGMLIWIDKVGGVKEYDLDNINNLNHYIGMRAIDPQAIPELRYMPWILGALVVTGLVVAAVGRRRVLYAWAGALAIAAVAGLYDFWKWTYDYGHNLDMETAIIKVPGQAYQPPILGTKQILNFTASSWPDIGGIAAGVAMALTLAAVVLAVRHGRATAPAGVPSRRAARRAAEPATASAGGR